jgi:hypothetical protein
MTNAGPGGGGGGPAAARGTENGSTPQASSAASISCNAGEGWSLRIGTTRILSQAADDAKPPTGNRSRH